MKKYLFIISILCLMSLLLAGCAKNGAVGGENNNPTTSEQSIENSPENQEQKSEASIGGVDVDLTALSSTMVYAEVYNIMMDPDSYVGKTIKGNGLYNSFYYEKIDKYFHYFIISDATGCCPQGLDFVWNGEHTYPDDYPEIDENIEVTGVFIKGEIDGQPYYYVAVDDLTIMK